MTDTTDEQITLQVSGSQPMNAFVSRPPTEHHRGGLLLLQEAYGVNDHIRDLAQRFARAGYVVIAPELYHRSGAGIEIPYDQTDKAKAELGKLDDSAKEADVRAAYGWLNSEAGIAAERIASIGYCMGGYVSFLANATLPLAAAISYYGGRITQLLNRTASLSGPMLLCWGNRDHSIDADQRNQIIHALETEEKTFIHTLFSGAQHGFFCDQRPTYNEVAAHQAWSLTLAFLGQHLRT